MAPWIVGGEHEAQAHVLDAAGHLLGGQVDVHAQGLQHVGAAGFRRHRAAAVLGHPGAGGGGHEGGGGGDVEGVGGVAAGAAGIHQAEGFRHRHLGGEFPHHHGGGGDLADGLLLDSQSGDEGGDHHRAHFAGHDLAHEAEHLVVEDLAMLDDAGQRVLGFHGRGHGRASSRKFFSN
jgi:hypothetical protein